LESSQFFALLQSALSEISPGVLAAAAAATVTVADSVTCS